MPDVPSVCTDTVCTRFPESLLRSRIPGWVARAGGDGGDGGDGGEGSNAAADATTATGAATQSRGDSIEDDEEEAEEEEVHTCHWWGGALSWLLLLEHTGRATPQLRTDIGVDLRHDNFAALARAMEHPCQVLFDRPSTAMERVALRRSASGGGGDSYDDAELAHGGGGGTCDDTELARKGLCDYSSEPPELPAAAPPPGALCAASGVPQLFPVAACCVFVL